MEKKKVICIVGPTASGKTSLSVKLARRLNTEIISADSMQIYKKINVGTAKVTKEEAEGIKHHLIDICDLNEKFSVADFQKMCYEKIEEITKKGKIPLIVGGTGLYVSSVVDNMNFENQKIDFEYRKYLENLAEEKGPDYLHEMLEKLDKESAKVIHKNNVKRVIRAIEIAKNQKETKSEHMEKEKIRKDNENSKYEYYIFCIDFPKEVIHERINKRVDIMLKDGILEEAKYVYSLNLDKDCTCMQAIGYKEFFPYIENKATLEECIERLKLETRKYSKRQMTWFRNKLNCIYLDGTKSKDELINEIIQYSHIK